MRIAVAVILVLHGAIHLMGFAKGFGLAEMAQLRQPISRPKGALWLLAALLLLAAAVMVFAAPATWWVVAICGVVQSQGLIAGAWSDAKFGTIANVLVLLAALFAGFVGVETTVNLR